MTIYGPNDRVLGWTDHLNSLSPLKIYPSPSTNGQIQEIR